MRARCGGSLGGWAGIRSLSVQEFVGAWLSARRCRAIWTDRGPGDGSSPQQALQPQACLQVSWPGPSPSRRRHLLLHLPRTRPTHLHSGPRGRQGNLPGDLGRGRSPRPATCSHASQPSPTCPSRKRAAQSPQFPPTRACSSSSAGLRPPAPRMRTVSMPGCHRLSLFPTSAASLQSTFHRWTQDRAQGGPLMLQWRLTQLADSLRTLDPL